jgi:hypothetical protein
MSCSTASKFWPPGTRPFADGGRVGLWTKADSFIHFDAIVIMPLDRAGKAWEAAGDIRAGITFALGP